MNANLMKKKYQNLFFAQFRKKERKVLILWGCIAHSGYGMHAIHYGDQSMSKALNLAYDYNFTEEEKN